EQAVQRLLRLLDAAAVRGVVAERAVDEPQLDAVVPGQVRLAVPGVRLVPALLAVVAGVGVVLAGAVVLDVVGALVLERAPGLGAGLDGLAALERPLRLVVPGLAVAGVDVR